VELEIELYDTTKTPSGDIEELDFDELFRQVFALGGIGKVQEEAELFDNKLELSAEEIEFTDD
jgi:hypothetical protein